MKVIDHLCPLAGHFMHYTVCLFVFFVLDLSEVWYNFLHYFLSAPLLLYSGMARSLTRMKGRKLTSLSDL